MNSGFDHNFGDLEESVIDRMAIEVPYTAKPKEVSVRISDLNFFHRINIKILHKIRLIMNMI
jgi:hypothetical protein